MHPLTHHDIIERVAPFSRTGRRVDLAAGDRLARRLVFIPVDRPAPSSADPDLVEVLALQEIAVASHRLTRTLTTCDGLTAFLEADGATPATLLDRVDAVAPHRHFRREGAATVAVSLRIDDAATDPVLAAATVVVDPLTLSLTIDDARARHADLTIEAPGAMPLPDDLLAVLGRRWSVLTRTATGWRGRLALRGREPQRSREAEADVARAARHLAATLAEPPARFHERWIGARWAVAARRAIPALVCVALIAASVALGSLELATDSVLRMLIFNAPPLLLVAFFAMRDLPRIVIPPAPRRARSERWRVDR